MDHFRRFICWAFGHKYAKYQYGWSSTIIMHGPVEEMDGMDKQLCWRCKRWIPTGD